MAGVRTRCNVPGVCGRRPCLRSRETHSTVTLTVERAPLAGPQTDRSPDLPSHTFFFNNELVVQGRSGDAFRKAGSGSRRIGEFCRERIPMSSARTKILIKRKGGGKIRRTGAGSTTRARTIASRQTAGVDRQVTPSNRPASAAPALVRGVGVRAMRDSPCGRWARDRQGFACGSRHRKATVRYRIKARPNDQLSFSFLGYKRRRMFYVGSKTTIDESWSARHRAIDDGRDGAGYDAKKNRWLRRHESQGDVSSAASSFNWMSGLSKWWPVFFGRQLLNTGGGGGFDAHVTLRGGKSSIRPLQQRGAVRDRRCADVQHTSPQAASRGLFDRLRQRYGATWNPEDIENITVQGSSRCSNRTLPVRRPPTVHHHHDRNPARGQDGAVSVTFTS